jgi:hypothetical protein
MQSSASVAATGTGLDFAAAIAVMFVLRRPRRPSCRRGRRCSYRRVDRHQQPLPAGEVLGGERDLLPPSQVIVIARTTRSTSPFFSAGMRSAALIARNWIFDGSPNIALAISRARSISKPTSSTGARVAVAEQVGVLADTDDEPAPLHDRGHARARRRLARAAAMHRAAGWPGGSKEAGADDAEAARPDPARRPARPHRLAVGRRTPVLRRGAPGQQHEKATSAATAFLIGTPGPLHHADQHTDQHQR